VVAYTWYIIKKKCLAFLWAASYGAGEAAGEEQCAGKVCKTTGQHRFALLKGSAAAEGQN